MAEPGTFISWCTEAIPPINAGLQAAPSAFVHAYQKSTEPGPAPPIEHVSPAAAVPTALAPGPVLWPQPVQYALAAFILVAAAVLAFQSFRTPAAGTETQPAPIAPMDLNQASEAELRLLPGVGPMLARRIMEYRQTKGKFRNIDELRSIQGIGTVTMARLRLRVMVDDPEPDPRPVEVERGAARPKTSRTMKPDMAKGNDKIDINSASAADMRRIPYVGPVLSENIVRYRGEHGSFRDIEDLCKVPGIKSKTLNKIRPYITLGAEQTQIKAP